MRYFQFLKEWKTFEHCNVEAETFEEALEKVNNRDVEWEEDGQDAYVTKRGWFEYEYDEELDDYGDEIDSGEW